MNILICGDIVARVGRESVFKYLPILKEKLSLDFVVVNGDNVAHGFGINSEMASSLFRCGADIITGGNHLFDQKDTIAFLEKEKRFLRPANMPDIVPGQGINETITKQGMKIVTIHLIGQKNMPIIGENPFTFANKLLEKYTLGKNANAIIVDFHAEVTSEKNALGHYLDGKVSVIVGTHTHIPTADERILKGGTAYQTDVGMCGDYDSVIGMQKNAIVDKFIKGYTNARFEPATSNATLCALFVEINDKTGLAVKVKAIQIDGVLSPRS